MNAVLREVRIQAVVLAALAALFAVAVVYGPLWTAIVVGLLVLLVALFFTLSLSTAVRERRRGWRLTPGGRDIMMYEEWRDGEWQGIHISAEPLTAGPPDYLISVPKHFPGWGQGRRDEIVARIRSECPEPSYRYESR